MGHSEILAALDNALAQIDRALAVLNRQGTEASPDCRHEAARRLLEEAARVSALRAQLSDLQGAGSILQAPASRPW